MTRREIHQGRHETGVGLERSTQDIDVVYYIRRDGLIKIGTTMRLVKRLHQLRCSREDVMAVEFGDRELERMRHAQFAHLLAKGREYFRPAPELLDHVAQRLPTTCGAPHPNLCADVVNIGPATHAQQGVSLEAPSPPTLGASS